VELSFTSPIRHNVVQRQIKIYATSFFLKLSQYDILAFGVGGGGEDIAPIHS
jgi:hypothetical protein